MNNSKLLYLVISIFLCNILIFANDFRVDQNLASIKVVKASGESSNDENFNLMMKVITHKRCLNCHPSDNTPKQGEDSHPHYFGIKRGVANNGFEATNCNTCHQEENNNFSGVPGAPHWGLAPASMSWEGLSNIEIANSFLDKSKNGGKTHEELVEHLTEDPLVLWAWEPGIDDEGMQREKPPVSKEDFIFAVKAWFDSGAIVPIK